MGAMRWRVAVALMAMLVVVPVAAAGASALSAGTRAVAAQPRPIAVSEALDLLAKGRATSARIVGEVGDLELVLRVRGGARTTPIPSFLVERAVDLARAGGVPLTLVKPTTIAGDAVPVAEEGGFSITAFLKEWGGLILAAAIVVLLFFTIRMFGGSRFTQKLKPVASTTRFDAVAGIDEIRDEVVEIADFLRAPARYQRLGAELPRGVILHGPPGTGKTLLARAVAGEAGVPFFSASGSEFVEVYSGLGSKRIRSLFEAARKAAPALLYIDEIDAVGGKRTGAPGGGEREQTLDQLLSEMDGFKRDPSRPVVVLASTNRLEDLDPALVRSGRFDRKIALGLPGREARREILDVHARTRPIAAGTTMSQVAAFTAGMAGADLAALCNEASFEAARAGHDEIDLADFRRALLRLAAGPEKRHRLLSEEERTLVAYHEMGHAIVGHLSPRCDPVDRVTVIPQGQALGVTISLPLEDRFLVTREECLQRMAMTMAGRAAEEIVFGEMTTGAADDLARATALARRMAGELGMAEETTAAALARPKDAGEGSSQERVERQARALLELAYTRARDLLQANLPMLHRSARLLLQREALDKDEIVEVLGARPGRTLLRAKAPSFITPSA